MSESLNLETINYKKLSAKANERMPCSAQRGNEECQKYLDSQLF